MAIAVATHGPMLELALADALAKINDLNEHVSVRPSSEGVTLDATMQRLTMMCAALTADDDTAFVALAEAWGYDGGEE